MRALWMVILLGAWAAARAGEGEGAPGTGEDPLARPLEEIEKGDAKARAAAARALGRLGDARAAPALRKAVGDGEAEVRFAAAFALADLKIADAAAVDLLIAGLRSEDWYTRWKSCLSLGQLGEGAAAAAPALVNAAMDPKLDVATEAATALTRVATDDPATLEGLARLLATDLNVNRPFLIGKLEAAKRSELALEWLATEMRTNRHGLAERARMALLDCGPSAIAAFTEAAKHEDPSVRGFAIAALARLKATDAGELIVKAVADLSPDVRYIALHAVAELNPPGGVRAAALALGDPAQEVRIAALATLKSLKTAEPAAGPGLVRALKEFGGEPEVDEKVLAAWHALPASKRRHSPGPVATRPGLVPAALTATGFEGLAAFLLAEENRPFQLHAWTVRLRLPEPGSPEDARAFGHLIDELEDNEHGAKLAFALREVLARDQEENLVAALRAPDAATRRAAAILLGHVARKREPAGPALAAAGKDPHPDVREAAEQALERLPPP
jgi:HEAT repeat protein